MSTASAARARACCSTTNWASAGSARALSTATPARSPRTWRSPRPSPPGAPMPGWASWPPRARSAWTSCRSRRSPTTWWWLRTPWKARCWPRCGPCCTPTGSRRRSPSSAGTARRKWAGESGNTLTGSAAPDGLQGVAVGEPPRTLGHAPFAALELLHLAGQRVPGDAVVLDQPGQLHPVSQQGRDDLAKAMVPLVGAVVDEDGVGLDIGAPLVEDHRLVPLDVGILQHEQVVVPALIERPQHRVALADEQPPAHAQQGGDHTRPAGDVGQPAQRADPRVHQVERLPAQDRDRVVHLGLDEPDVGTGEPRDPARLRQRGGGEVQPGHAGAEAGQRDGVGTDMALQVHAAQAADVTEQRQ